MDTIEQTAEHRWVAFGETGAVGSIRELHGEFEVQLFGDDAPRGAFPSLVVAKSALHSALTPGSAWPEFREH